LKLARGAEDKEHAMSVCRLHAPVLLADIDLPMFYQQLCGRDRVGAEGCSARGKRLEQAGLIVSPVGPFNADLQVDEHEIRRQIGSVIQDLRTTVPIIAHYWLRRTLRSVS
jgi:hypothetical protein